MLEFYFLNRLCPTEGGVRVWCEYFCEEVHKQTFPRFCPKCLLSTATL